MIIIAFNGPTGCLETDVVEPRERCSVDVLDLVVRNKEQLLPTHKHTVGVTELAVIELIGVERLYVWSKRLEPAPMLPVHILVSVPFTSEERVATADDLTVKECRESGILLSQSLDLQIATHSRVLVVNVFKVDLDMILVSFALLVASESAPTVKRGGGEP